LRLFLNLLFSLYHFIKQWRYKGNEKTVLIKNIKSKKGFSLLELLLVLGIIAALVVAAFIVYPKVQASQRSQAESNNIATIQAGVKAFILPLQALLV
jgi:prepilin-type N-terminal cleavage/methylation domain-containing protein